MIASVYSKEKDLPEVSWRGQQPCSDQPSASLLWVGDEAPTHRVRIFVAETPLLETCEIRLRNKYLLDYFAHMIYSFD